MALTWSDQHDLGRDFTHEVFSRLTQLTQNSGLKLPLNLIIEASKLKWPGAKAYKIAMDWFLENKTQLKNSHLFFVSNQS